MRRRRLRTRNRAGFPAPRNKLLTIVSSRGVGKAQEWLQHLLALAEQAGLDLELFPQPAVSIRTGGQELRDTLELGGFRRCDWSVVRVADLGRWGIDNHVLALGRAHQSCVRMQDVGLVGARFGPA
jgi:hypothetical protein